ncbi:MAG TPA: sigma 54-interacting transcriptional regulator [Candidatus Cloacimonadota bacterium]|nr:sigma 54-interacting transcriptional regulator [Candidatus Cloacimonadota bacterium]
MEALKEWKNKLQKVGKLDKLEIYADIIKYYYDNREPEFINDFREAVTIFNEYLQFDVKPRKETCLALQNIFLFTFRLIRYISFGRHFKEVLEEYKRNEKYFQSSNLTAFIYDELCYLFWRFHDFDAALEFGIKSYELAEKSDKAILQGRYSNVGFIYESRNDFENATKYYQLQLNFGLQTNADRAVFLAYSGFGRINLSKGKFASAINYFQEALKYFSELNSEDVMAVYNNLGIAYGRMGNLEESLRYFNTYINDDTRARYPDMYCSFLMNSSNCYTTLGKWDETEKYLFMALEFAEQIKNPEYMAVVLIDLGNLERTRQNWQKSISYFKKSKTIIMQTQNILHDILIDQGLGIAYFNLNDISNAIKYLESSLAKSEKEERNVGIGIGMRYLSQIYEQQNDLEKALYYHKKMHQYEMARIEEKEKSAALEKKKNSPIPGNPKLSFYNSLISAELSDLIKSPFVGNSAAMRKVVEMARIAAKQDVSVLLTGESGTGKEIIARIIHYSSVRKDNPFIVVNSAAFTESLAESAFFGSEKGAFTGAEKTRFGYIEAAKQGSLFLDEIGEMSLNLQAKLLRALEEHVISRLGSTKEIKVDFRLICATNKNLYELSDKQQFRFDLLNRLNTLEIYVPTLKERKEDIPLLLEYFLSFFSQQKEVEKPILSKAALDLLLEYDFPGNVRELKNILQRTVLFSNKAVIEPEDLMFPPQKTEKADSTIYSSLNLAECETAVIRKAMQISGNVQVKAAKLLGISPFALSRRLMKMSK